MSRFAAFPAAVLAATATTVSPGGGTPAGAATSYARPAPGVSPVGANDWSCRPSADRPYLR